MDEFLAMIKLFAGNFDPEGFASCDGRLLPIMQNQALFSLLGTQFGGDGRTTFALPDLRPVDETYEIVTENGQQVVKVSKVKRQWHSNEPRHVIAVQGLYPMRP